MFKWVIGVEVNLVLSTVQSPLKKRNLYLGSSCSRSDSNLGSDGSRALRRRRCSSHRTGGQRLDLLQKRIDNVRNNQGSGVNLVSVRSVLSVQLSLRFNPFPVRSDLFVLSSLPFLVNLGLGRVHLSWDSNRSVLPRRDRWRRRRKVARPRRVQLSSGTTAITARSNSTPVNRQTGLRFRSNKRPEKVGSCGNRLPEKGGSSGNPFPSPSKSLTKSSPDGFAKLSDVVASFPKLEANPLALVRAQQAVPDQEAEDGQESDGPSRNSPVKRDRAARAFGGISSVVDGIAKALLDQLRPFANDLRTVLLLAVVLVRGGGGAPESGATPGRSFGQDRARKWP